MSAISLQVIQSQIEAFEKQSFLQEVSFPFPLSIAREDCIHPDISGNKLRKLKYNVLLAAEQQHPIVTFGGAYSNHIAATAAACKLFNLPCYGIIRGDELSSNSNSTLKTASDLGMQLLFVSREDYKQKENSPAIQKLLSNIGSHTLVPEGGSNSNGIKGCMEIYPQLNLSSFDVIAVSAGTGTTAAGIIESSANNQEVWVFSSLKGSFLEKEIAQHTRKTNWRLINDYHFGGYGKVSPELFSFISTFKKQTDILLDPIYTGKMMFGLSEMNQQQNLNKVRICAIHTGGLQGWNGFPQHLVG